MTKNTLNRIKEYIDSKGISVSAFEKSMSFSNGSFASQLKNNKTIGVDKLENILKVYTDINPEWLLTGKGEMIKGEERKVVATPIATNKDEEIQLLKEMLKDKERLIKSYADIIDMLKDQLEATQTPQPTPATKTFSVKK